jgi:hypothetical protein
MVAVSDTSVRSAREGHSVVFRTLSVAINESADTGYVAQLSAFNK